MPRPAATATGLCETTHIFSGQRSASIGKPIGGLMAGTPSRSRAVTTARQTSFTSSPAWWNSRFATDRAGLRIGSRFIRQTTASNALVRG